jgi:predicted transcriptional regulator
MIDQLRPKMMRLRGNSTEVMKKRKIEIWKIELWMNKLQHKWRLVLKVVNRENLILRWKSRILMMTKISKLTLIDALFIDLISMQETRVSYNRS